MQTVYVPVKASDEMPPDRERISIILDGVYLTAGKNISGAICLDYPAGHVVDEYYDRVTWLKPTEAVLLTKEDADRVKEWISVEDSLPPIDIDVLVYTSRGAITQDRQVGSMGDTNCWYERENVTHWMPLPPKPKSK